MTHAAKTHDLIELATEMRDRLDDMIKAEEERAKLREREEAELHAKLALANAARLLSKIAKQSRVSDGDRAQIKGVLNQLERVA
jgi:regulator of protease activity HflC (stomatin/prohibitin superfamily)